MVLHLHLGPLQGNGGPWANYNLGLYTLFKKQRTPFLKVQYLFILKAKNLEKLKNSQNLIKMLSSITIAFKNTVLSVVEFKLDV
jgi:hypothetical protein